MSLKASELKVGDSRTVVVVDDLTRTQIVMYAGASGDYNPLHSDDKFTKEIAGYPSVFAHGMLSMGMIEGETPNNAIVGVKLVIAVVIAVIAFIGSGKARPPCRSNAGRTRTMTIVKGARSSVDQSARLRLLYVSPPTGALGGIETYSRELTAAMADAGHDVEIVETGRPASTSPSASKRFPRCCSSAWRSKAEARCRCSSGSTSVTPCRATRR